MRHTRTRRKFKFILTTILVVCVILFLEIRIEAFVPEVKSFAELKVEEAFNGRVKFSIGSLSGGIINPIVANDIKIIDSRDVSAGPYLAVNSIRTNYRIWDFLFSGRNPEVIPNMVLGMDRIDATFATLNKEVSGFVHLENAQASVKTAGYVNLLSRDRLDFSGVVKEDSFEIEIRPSDGSVKAEGRVDDTGELKINFKATHLKLGDYDIVADGTLKIRMGRSGLKSSVSIEGELETKNLLLNYKPFLDLKVSFKICDNLLEISDLAMGDLVKASGRIAISKPNNIKFELTTNNLSIAWLMRSLGVADPSSILTGTMNGKFFFYGPLENLNTVIQLDIRDGTIATLNFDYLSARLKGDGPIIRIEDSRITRQSGYFSIAGEMDMRKAPRSNLFDNIRLVTDERAIDWDGLDITKTQGTQEVRMMKRINDDINIGVRKFTTDEKIDESLKYGDEVGLEYKLHPTDSLKLMVGQDEDFFGFEHKDKF